jgi:hypothetical protein
MRRSILFVLGLALAFSVPALAQFAPPTPVPASVLCNTCQTSLSVTASSSRVAFPSTNPNYNAVTLYNAGTKDAYVVQGDVTAVATTSGIRIPAGVPVTIWTSGTYLAGITGGSDTTTLYIYQSNGQIGFVPPGGASAPIPPTTITANQGTQNAGGAASWWVQIYNALTGVKGADGSTIASSSNPLPSNVINGLQGATLPSSTLTLTSATTAYTAGQLIANSATAGSVVVPSFSIANSGGYAAVGRFEISTNDATSTAWGGQTISLDLWDAAPTFTNGDRAAFLPATGVGHHIALFTCVMNPEYGDGAYASCYPNVGSFVILHPSSGTAIYWSLTAQTGSGVTGASEVWTVKAELLN